MPSKSTPFTPSSILFRPRMVEAPGTAPGSERFITTPFIAISGLRRQTQYKR